MKITVLRTVYQKGRGGRPEEMAVSGCSHHMLGKKLIGTMVWLQGRILPLELPVRKTLQLQPFLAVQA
jgi:hypothetical protein